MRQPKLAIITGIILFILFCGIIFLAHHKEINPIKVNTRDQPTLGSIYAPVHMVIFEEPKCLHCAKFHEEIFPLIKKEFINTGKVTYTLVPISFLPGSLPAANALLSVYYQDPKKNSPDLFFAYLNTMYEQVIENSHLNLISEEILLDIARKSSAKIDLALLSKSIKNNKYIEAVKQNTQYAHEIMDGHISTPTLYINGVRIEEFTFDNIKTFIEEIKE